MSKRSASTAHGSTASYVVGFVSSIILTMTTYLLVAHHAFATNIIVTIIIMLALIQFGVQLLFFLHLGDESRPRWKLWVFAGMTGVVLILVIGSIWIMNNLNYHMPRDINHYLHTEEGI